MPVLRKTIRSIDRRMAVFIALMAVLSPHAAIAGPPESAAEPSAWSSPIHFFQKYISKADGDRCPMYPSCSHYAATAVQRHGAIKGWILACDRLLRCGHDEVRLSPKVRVNGKALVYDPLKANTLWWSKP